MNAVEINKDVYWVGAIDWNLRNFHGYLTQRGSTYNAYLIVDERVTLIDATKTTTEAELISRISSVIDPSKIDLIVANHVEMDHSGTIPDILKLAPNAEIITSPKGVAGLKAHYGEIKNLRAIEPGETVSLGKRSLQFVPTPMVHWPDNMLTYCPEEKILFSNDAFGQHLATSKRFDYESDVNISLSEAKKYYANIVMPYAVQVRKALEIAKTLNIEIIAPSHGVIWKKHIKEILAQYAEWAAERNLKKALIVYDTMWKSTEKIAGTLVDAFNEKGYDTKLFSLQHNHISDIITEVLAAEYVCVGTSTLNKNMLPTVAAFLAYLKGLTPKNKKSFVFGSFGWASVAIKEVTDILEQCGYDIKEVLETKYIPSKEVLASIKSKVLERLKL